MQCPNPKCGSEDIYLANQDSYVCRKCATPFNDWQSSEIARLTAENAKLQNTISLLSKNSHVTDLMNANGELMEANIRLQARVEELQEGYPGIAHDMEALRQKISSPTRQLAEANKKIEGHKAFERSVNEALNMGDGSYRP